MGPARNSAETCAGQPAAEPTGGASALSVIFRQAMRELASGVSVIATRDADGPHGLTATAVMSICTDPPMLAACVNRSASAHDPIVRTRAFSVNILCREDQLQAAAFSSTSSRDLRFASDAWRTSEEALPHLQTALAVFECRMTQQYLLGTHSLLIGEVERVTANHGAPPLLYFDGTFGSLARLSYK